MDDQKNPGVGKHGPYYVSVVSNRTGKRNIYPNISTKQEAKTRKQEKDDDSHRAHAYEYNQKEGRYIKITS